MKYPRICGAVNLTVTLFAFEFATALELLFELADALLVLKQRKPPPLDALSSTDSAKLEEIAVSDVNFMDTSFAITNATGNAGRILLFISLNLSLILSTSPLESDTSDSGAIRCSAKLNISPVSWKIPG